MLIDVDGGSYVSACSQLYDCNHGIIDAVTTLNSTLGGGGSMAGSDTGGDEWATQYDQVATKLVQAGCDLGEAMGKTANLLNASLRNHEGADYGARISGPPTGTADDGDPDPNHWTETLSPAQLPSAKGGTGDQPSWLHWIIGHLEGLLWPDADTAKMRTMGQAWITASTSVGAYAYAVDAAKAEIGTQQSPEIPNATAALAELKQHTTDLANAYKVIGQACNDYAKHVDDHHAMVEDELKSFIEWTAGIEIVGGIVALFTFGGGEAAAQAAEAAEVANAASKVVRILRALLQLAHIVASTITGIIDNVDQMQAGLKKFLDAKTITALEKAGVSLGQGMSQRDSDAAYVGMNKEGGHATRHFVQDGLIDDKGSLASKVAKFKELTQPILQHPSKVFPWTVFNVPCTGYAGVVNGRKVVVFVAGSGAYAGKVLTAVVATPDQIVTWGL